MKTTPKDFFIHLGALIALYVSAVALIDLAFSVVNKLLPDALSPYFSASSIVWPISILIVGVPFLYVLEWMVARDIRLTPEKSEIWIRRWKIYLTLFLTAATIATDLIVLINTYLNGEVSSRFIWKVLIVLIVSGTIFAYYILMRRTDSVLVKRWRTILSCVGIVFVLAGISGGFVVVGSPAKQRALRFDEQRVNDLSGIQSQVIEYWRNNGKLPANIQSLSDPLTYYSLPHDPETLQNYEYVTKTSPTDFELCATFSLASEDQTPSALAYSIGEGIDSNWDHAAGHVCFERKIDPKLYPVNLSSLPPPPKGQTGMTLKQAQAKNAAR